MTDLQISGFDNSAIEVYKDREIDTTCNTMPRLSIPRKHMVRTQKSKGNLRGNSEGVSVKTQNNTFQQITH